MKKTVVVAFIAAILLCTGVAGGDDKVGGEIVWKKDVRGKTIASVTKRLDAAGMVEYEVWSDSLVIYQEYPLFTTGYSGAPARFIVREIRPHQPKKDAAARYGIRDPSTLYRAAHVEWAVRLDRDDGSTLFIEVRSVSQNYLIILTEILPVPNKPAQKPVQLGVDKAMGRDPIMVEAE